MCQRLQPRVSEAATPCVQVRALQPHVVTWLSPLQVRDLHREAESVFDLRSLVVQGMTKDSRTLVRLFERCGERDLRFVVRSGLLFGGLLGLLQMLLWRVWSPWWPLALLTLTLS